MMLYPAREFFMESPGITLSTESKVLENYGILEIYILYFGIFSNNFSGSRPITLTSSKACFLRGSLTTGTVLVNKF